MPGLDRNKFRILVDDNDSPERFTDNELDFFIDNGIIITNRRLSNSYTKNNVPDDLTDIYYLGAQIELLKTELHRHTREFSYSLPDRSVDKTKAAGNTRDALEFLRDEYDEQIKIANKSGDILFQVIPLQKNFTKAIE